MRDQAKPKYRKVTFYKWHMCPLCVQNQYFTVDIYLVSESSVSDFIEYLENNDFLNGKCYNLQFLII